MAARNRVTVDSLLEELDEARALALRVDQPSAAIQASTTKAKLVGLMVDRKESGAPGDFSHLGTTEEVLAKARELLGDEAAASLERSLLTAQPTEPEAEPAEQRPEGETTH